MRTGNLKKTQIKPYYNDDPSIKYSLFDKMQEALVLPAYTPVNASQPAVIQTDDGCDVSPTMASMFLGAALKSENRSQIEAEEWLKDFYDATLEHFDKESPFSIDSLFVIQAAAKYSFPYPSDVCQYTPSTDVIPASQGLLAKTVSYGSYLAVMAFYTRSDTLGVYFKDEAEFEAFKKYLDAYTANMTLPGVTANLLKDFKKKTALKSLTESLRLRNSQTESLQPFSFPRILVSALMKYCKMQNDESVCGVLPFSLRELFTPQTVVFINVKNHAKASPKRIKDEWNLINCAILSNIKILSNKQLNKLTEGMEIVENIQKTLSGPGFSNELRKKKNLRFRPKAPDAGDVLRYVKSLISHMENISVSKNTYKTVKSTYMKPNRRQPDNMDLPGKTKKNRFKPDLHLYIDTSGSINEENYKSEVMTAIFLAKKLNVDLYITFFSHIMSQSNLIPVKNRSISAIYHTILNLPKPNGGTDFAQIWNYINKSPKRLKELSLIITDFGYGAPHYYIKHPKNLYYIPCDNMEWGDITKMANGFAKSMAHILPLQEMKKRMLC